jgi:ABC-2 type transport system ATP-binding protein
MNAIVIKNLTKSFKGVRAVDHLSLEVQQGELLALLGVNGAGKTTTIRMLSCLTRPDEGDATLCGHSICTDPHTVKQVIALSPQETAVAPNLTVAENLVLLVGAHGASKAAANAQANAMLDTMGLREVAQKRAKTLSGGWQRRLSIAMALISQPQVLFLDEPTLGLDVLARGVLWDVIRDLKGKTTVLLTTHYMEEAEALADRVAVLAAGKLVTVDTPAALKAQTGTETLADAFVALVKEAV